jgi:hypothetical protein
LIWEVNTKIVLMLLVIKLNNPHEITQQVSQNNLVNTADVNHRLSIWVLT